MWAIGVNLYVLLSKGKFPFDAGTPPKLMHKIKNDEPEPLPESVSSFMREIVNKLLDKNP